MNKNINTYPSECDEAPELVHRRRVSQDDAFHAAMGAAGYKVTGPSREPGTERAGFISRPATHCFPTGA